MNIRNQFAAVGSAVILITALVGCSGQAPTAEPSAQAGTTQLEAADSDAVSEGSGTTMLDPAWPWPQQLPRPSVPLSSEFTGPNVLGEGGLYTVEFTSPDLDYAQHYADTLAGAGSDTYMTSLTIDTTTLFTVFSFMGALE